MNLFCHFDTFDFFCLLAVTRHEFDPGLSGLFHRLSQFSLFLQAIDEYLFFLHKQDFFPPTFHLQRALGQERFRKMEEDWQAAAAQVAQSTEQSELEPGHDRQDEMLCC